MIREREEPREFLESRPRDDAASGAPLVVELRPAPRPVEAFRKLASLPYVIFLDSAAKDETHGRYSYLAAHPFELIEAREDCLTILAPLSSDLRDPRYEPICRQRTKGGARTPGITHEDRAAEDDSQRDAVEESPGAPSESRGPLSILERRLRAWPSEEVDGLPPFQGGAAGLFSYGLSRSIERLPAPRHDEFRIPDLAVGLYDWVLAFDHLKESCHLISHGFPAIAFGPREERARERTAQVERLLREGGAPPAEGGARGHPRPLSRGELAPHWTLPGSKELSSNFRKQDYMAAVARGIEYIHAGDVFQVNLSQRLIHPETCSPLEFYVRLRERNPAPFAGYFDTGQGVISSSSPEQFLSLRHGLVVTRPIKGTRSRGYTPEEDSYRQVDLRQSEKDRAENVMIVDLLRNDLSRVSRPGSVTVPRLFELERYPTVHHLVSEVRGRLREGMGAIDLLRASFPGGSITGAPKVRAMEIIAELEPTARGAYCGCLGWISFHGDMGTSILIRTVTLSRGWMQLPAGGGIVADSRPADEYRETLDKAAGMLRALE